MLQKTDSALRIVLPIICSLLAAFLVYTYWRDDPIGAALVLAVLALFFERFLNGNR